MPSVLRLGSLGLAATVLLSACSASLPPQLPDAPAASRGPVPRPPIEGQVMQEAMPDFPSDVQPLATVPRAPQPPVGTRDRGLILPTGGGITLDRLYEDLPPSIPQQSAHDWLSPLPGAIPQGFGQPVPGGIEGAYPGAIPELLAYQALARCRYYRYMNFWVPYILVGGTYYPYAYSPYYDPRLKGMCAYPVFYDYGNYCYPYYFLSLRYRYGYLDWEYHWPLYRSRYRYRYHDDVYQYRRYWSLGDFQNWLDYRSRYGRKDRPHEYRPKERDDTTRGRDDDTEVRPKRQGDERHVRRNGRPKGTSSEKRSVRQSRDRDDRRGDRRSQSDDDTTD